MRLEISIGHDKLIAINSFIRVKIPLSIFCRKEYFRIVDQILSGLCRSQALSSPAAVADSSAAAIRTEYPDFGTKTEDMAFDATCPSCITSPATYYIG